MQTDLATETLKTFAASGPMGLAVYFLGRAVLKAWDQDREQLRSLATQNVTALAQCTAALTQNTAVLARVLERLDKQAA